MAPSPVLRGGGSNQTREAIASVARKVGAVGRAGRRLIPLPSPFRELCTPPKPGESFRCLSRRGPNRLASSFSRVPCNAVAGGPDVSVLARGRPTPFRRELGEAIVLVLAKVARLPPPASYSSTGYRTRLVLEVFSQESILGTHAAYDMVFFFFLFRSDLTKKI